MDAPKDSVDGTTNALVLAAAPPVGVDGGGHMHCTG